MLFHHVLDARPLVVREVLLQQLAAFQQGGQDDGVSRGGISGRGLCTDCASQTIQIVRIGNIAGATLQNPTDLWRGSAGGNQTVSQRVKELSAGAGPAHHVLFDKLVELYGTLLGNALVDGEKVVECRWQFGGGADCGALFVAD